MMLTILDILGGVFINLGILMINLKKSNKPEFRIKANICVIIGCLSLATLFAISTPYIFSVSVQIGVVMSSCYGIYNCKKEIKKKLKFEDWKSCIVNPEIAEKCNYFEFSGRGWTMCSCPEKECVKVKGEFPVKMSDICYDVITLCGSSKFADKFIEIEKELSSKGNCVLLPYWDGFLHKEDYPVGEWRGRLRQIHYRKIDLSTHIFVVNADGYIGEDTQKDIEYAKKKRKHILYLEP